MKQEVLYNFLRSAVSSFDKVIVKKDHFNFRCNVCGDSKRKKKMRGHLIKANSKNKSYWVYKCFNEGCPAAGDGNAWSAERWLKKFFPTIYSQYIKTLLRCNEETKQIKIKKVKNPIFKKEETKKFKTINTNNLKYQKIKKIAIELCKNRKIPKEVWRKWYICNDGVYKNRLIIPFYDNKNKIYYFQARALYKNQEPKYLNMKTNKENAIYNYFNINRLRPILVTEGPIDSLFLQNSISIIGLSVSETIKNKLEKLKCYYIFDNDVSGNEKSKKILLEKKYIFLWKRFLKDNNLSTTIKDINDVIINSNIQNLSYKDLQKYFSNNLYDFIYS